MATSQRKYESSHPWLTFRLELTRAPIELWLLLGEMRSKCEHILSTPLMPETARELHALYLARGAHATTAIEGNTLSEAEVRQRLEGDLRLPPSREYLGVEVDNVIRLANGITAEGFGAPAPLAPERILEINRELLRGLALPEDVVPGQLRRHSVTVGRYLGAPAEDLQFLLRRLCDWLAGPDFAPPPDDAAMRFVYGLVRAVVAHLYLAWIHPFGDGNGRTARMIEFQLLVEAGIASPAAHLLSNHYNQTRTEYYLQLDRASRAGGDPVPFVRYAVRGFVDELASQIRLLHEQHRRLLWRTFVMEAFPDRTSPVHDRRLRLVMALGERNEAVPATEIARLTPFLAATYARLTVKTLSRDLASLEQLGLVERLPGGYRARTDLVKALEPRRRTPDDAGRPGQAARHPEGDPT